MEFNVIRTCKDCKNEDFFYLTKVQSAFQLYDSSEIWNSLCSKCGSTECLSLGGKQPKVDQQLLDMWGNSATLHFWTQDEEIFLAETEYFHLILNAIDKSKYPERKITVLIQSICVLLYDNTETFEKYADEENFKREKDANLIRPELIKRKDKIIKEQGLIMEYIKQVVFPQIGIENWL